MKKLTCIKCPVGCSLEIIKDENNNLKITGYMCPLGIKFANQELIEPKRTLTTTINSDCNILVPVKSSSEISLKNFKKAMDIINKITVKLPIKLGDVIISNILDEKADIIATKTIQIGDKNANK